MFKFTDSERKYLTELRAISKDREGREVLVGLTLEETEFYIQFGRSIVPGEKKHEEADRYLKLNQKHEQARMEVISTENLLRTDNITLH